jgi:dimeric dUTPase (all-alpha-NTP-PPase superfamily)
LLSCDAPAVAAAAVAGVVVGYVDGLHWAFKLSLQRQLEEAQLAQQAGKQKAQLNEQTITGSPVH